MRRTPLSLFPPSLLVLAAIAAPATAQDDDGAWLRQVARTYRQFGRVDDELRWAPLLCRMPLPSRARVSGAATAHSRKVYFVYASDRRRYVELTRGASGTPPIGFTVVKEAFAPRALTGAEAAEGDAWSSRIRIPGAPASTLGPTAVDPSETPNVYRPAHGEAARSSGPEPAAASTSSAVSERAESRPTPGGPTAPWTPRATSPRRVSSEAAWAATAARPTAGCSGWTDEAGEVAVTPRRIREVLESRGRL